MRRNAHAVTLWMQGWASRDPAASLCGMGMGTESSLALGGYSGDPKSPHPNAKKEKQPQSCSVGECRGCKPEDVWQGTGGGRALERFSSLLPWHGTARPGREQLLLDGWGWTRSSRCPGAPTGTAPFPIPSPLLPADPAGWEALLAWPGDSRVTSCHRLRAAPSR